MDQSENKGKQSLSQLIKSQFQRKLAKLLLSVSVFSLFFSHSYWLHSSYFNFHNTLPFKLFSHALDKNCIFLLCNGLLVFLAKYSGLISSSSSKHNNDINPSDHDDHSFKSYEEPKSQLLEKEIALESTVETRLANNIVMEGRQEEEEAEAENFTVEEEEQGGEKWGLIRVAEEDKNAAAFEEEDDEQEFGGISESYEREEDEEEEVEVVEGNRVLSTEELNKKFDEFIRKMKEELRIEARQQLVMV